MSEHRGVKYTEEEFKKLPKDKQEKILKNRKAREARTKMLAALETDATFASTVTESQKNAKFNKLFKTVRKNLLILKAKKEAGMLDGSDLLEETYAMLDAAKSI